MKRSSGSTQKKKESNEFDHEEREMKVMTLIRKANEMP
jgi:hypothetical protein